MRTKLNLIPIWLLCAALLPASMQAQLAFITNADNTLTVTGYTGPPWTVTIPATTNGLTVTSIGANAFYGSSVTSIAIPNSVTSIGSNAFYHCFFLTNATIGTNVISIGVNAFYNCIGLRSVTIPNSVTSIGDYAFTYCHLLTDVTIGDSVTNIGDYAFFNSNLTNVTIPDSVTSIEDAAFSCCTSLTSVTIPGSVNNIGTYAFANCKSPMQAYFQGNAPKVDGVAGSADTTVFSGETGKAYYVPGTTGWSSTFGGLPTALWYQPNPVILDRSCVLGATRFGFTISWATNIPVVVEASTNLASPAWTPVATNTLVNGTNYFSDRRWPIYPIRYFRLRSP